MRIAIVTFVLALLTSVAAAHASQTPGRVVFDVLRNGQPFGTHEVTVSRATGQLIVASRAELRAGVGPVTLFRYEQACRETWDDGGLVSLDCATLRDGKRVRVQARRTDNGLRVTGASARATIFPLDALPTSWWTKPPTALASMIDTETGARMPLRVADLGRETIDAGGRRVVAHHVRVEGTLAVDLWYDAAGRWIGCAFSARGQRIQYRLASPIDAAPSQGVRA